MPFSAADRKAELVRAGVTQQSVADACGVDFTFVSHVIAGRKSRSDKAQKVMAYVAGRLGCPVDEVFPPPVVVDERRMEERRDGADRRIPRERRKSA